MSRTPTRLLMAFAVAAIAATALAAGSGPAPAGAETAPSSTAPLVDGLPGDLRLNQIQVVGTHNSFHVQPPQAIINAVAPFYSDARMLEFLADPARSAILEPAGASDRVGHSTPTPRVGASRSRGSG